MSRFNLNTLPDSVVTPEQPLLFDSSFAAAIDAEEPFELPHPDPLIDNPFKEVKYFTVDHYELNEFIQRHFHMKDFEGHLEANNDTTETFQVDGELSEYNERRLGSLIVQEYCTCRELGIILNRLCQKNIIPAGQYMVRFSW